VQESPDTVARSTQLLPAVPAAPTPPIVLLHLSVPCYGAGLLERAQMHATHRQAHVTQRGCARHTSSGAQRSALLQKAGTRACWPQQQHSLASKEGCAGAMGGRCLTRQPRQLSQNPAQGCCPRQAQQRGCAGSTCPAQVPHRTRVTAAKARLLRTHCWQPPAVDRGPRHHQRQQHVAARTDAAPSIDCGRSHNRSPCPPAAPDNGIPHMHLYRMSHMLKTQACGPA
jgi:hypothetical protein